MIVMTNVDTYKKRKCVLASSNSPVSSGIISAMLMKATENDDEYELSVVANSSGFVTLGSYQFKVPATATTDLLSHAVLKYDIIWHSSGNNILLTVDGRLLLFHLKWLDKKHFNAEVSYKDALFMFVHLNSEDCLPSEYLGVQFSFLSKKLLKSDIHLPYITSVVSVKDSVNSLVVGTVNGMYSLLSSWENVLTVPQSATTSPDGFIQWAHKCHSEHTLLRVWESGRRVPLLPTTSLVRPDGDLHPLLIHNGIPIHNPTSNSLNSPSISGSSDHTDSESLSNGSTNAGPYTYSHIAITALHSVHCQASKVNGCDVFVGTQSDGSLTLTVMQPVLSGLSAAVDALKVSDGDNPQPTSEVFSSGHIHPVLLTGYSQRLPNRRRKSGGDSAANLPSIYQRQGGDSGRYTSRFVTEYDALMQAQSTAAQMATADQMPQPPKFVLSGQAEEEISRALSVQVVPSAHLSSGIVSAKGGSSMSFTLIATVATKHLLRSGASVVECNASQVEGKLLEDRMESISLVTWTVSVHSSFSAPPRTRLASVHADFECSQSTCLSCHVVDHIAGTPSYHVAHNATNDTVLVFCPNTGVITIRPTAGVHTIYHALSVGNIGAGLLSHVTFSANKLVVTTNHNGGSKLSVISLLIAVDRGSSLASASQSRGLMLLVDTSAGATCGVLYAASNQFPDQSFSKHKFPSISRGKQAHFLGDVEEVLAGDAIKLPRALVSDIQISRIAAAFGSDKPVHGARLVVASSQQVETTYLCPPEDNTSRVSQKPATRATPHNYFALISSGCGETNKSGSNTDTTAKRKASKFSFCGSTLYIYNKSTQKWRTTLLSVPHRDFSGAAATVSSSSLNNGQQVRHNLAVVGKFSKASVVTFVPHIADFIDSFADDSLHTPHSLASRGSYTIFEHDENHVAASAVPSGHRRQRSDDYSNGTISKTIQESMVFHRRSSSQDSVSDQVQQLQARVRSESASSNNSSVSSSTAGRTPHQYYLSLNQTRQSSLSSKSRQLTTHSNNSIYSQITTTIAVAFSCSHTLVLLTRRRHAYYLEIITREANRDSLSCGNPQPSVHKILPLPIGLVPATLSTQDIVRLVSGGDGTDSHNDSFVSKSGISASRRNSRTRTTPTNSISRTVPHTPGSTATQSGALRINTSLPVVPVVGVPEQVGDLDSNSSTHSSVNASVNNSTGVHFLNRTNSVFNMDPGGAAGSGSSRGDSCVAVVSTTNNIFLAYQITPIYSVSSIGGSGSSPRHHSNGATGVSVTDYQIIELYTVGLNELCAATANPSSNAKEPQPAESKSEPSGGWMTGEDAGFVMKSALFPLNTAIYDFQKSRLSKFKSLQLPYLCLLLLSRHGSVHLVDPYEKTATRISTSAAAVVDISHVSAHVMYGCVSHRTESGVESPGKVITYNDLFVLHTNDSGAPDTLFATFSHKDDSSHLSEREESQSAADSVVLSHLETDELFFVNLAQGRTEAANGTRREDDGVRLVSLQIPTDLEKTQGSTYAGHILSSGSGGNVCVLRHSPVAPESLPPPVDSLCVVGEVLCHKTSLAADMFLSFLEKHSALDTRLRESNLEEEVAAPAKKQNTSRTMRVEMSSGGSDVGESELSAVLLDIMQSVLNCHLVCPSSNSALLDTLETSLRVIIADNHKLRTVQNKQASALRNTVSSEDYFTSYLFQCCPLLLIELLTRVGRKLEPTISKQIFPVSLGSGSEHSPPQKLGILSLYQYCLANNFITYSGRLLSLVCEHCGGSEKHQSTVLSLLLALEFLYCSMSCVSLGNVVECVEFCHRLEDMLHLHCGDIFGRGGDAQTSASGSHGGLTHSYVETIFTRSLAHLQRLHARAVTSRILPPQNNTQLEQETKEKPAPFYIGKNVVWLLSSLFPADSSVEPAVSSAPTNKPPAVSVLSMKNPSHLRSTVSNTHQSILQPYQFRSAELLQSQYGTHAISEILCQDSVSETSSALPSSITMCLVTATIRNYFSSSGHYMSAALLICSLLRSSISKQMVFKTLSQRRNSAYILRTESQEDGNNSIWPAPDQKVRRILFILRLNKILARGDVTTIRHALLGTGGAQSYNAQALRRLVEAEMVHFHASAHGGPHGFSATPRDTPRFFISPPHDSLSPSLADHHQVDRSSYFELSDDLFSQSWASTPRQISTAAVEAPSRDALSAMDLLKALVVGFLLVGDDHCAYLLCKVILPYLVVAKQTSDEVLGAVFRPETTDYSASSPLTDRELTSERFCIRSAESQAQLVGLLLR